MTPKLVHTHVATGLTVRGRTGEVATFFIQWGRPVSNRKHAVTGCALAVALAFGAALGPTAANAQAAVDRYVVTFKPGVAAAARNAVAELGGRVEIDLSRINAIAVALPKQAVDGLKQHPAIEMVEADPMRHALQFTGGFQINPDGVLAVQANLVPYNASGARKLCIVDSGYDITHEDLQKTNVSGANLTRSGDWNTDESSHGTHVAGTVAALNNATGVLGVVGSGQMNLHIAKVFDASGSARSSVIMKAVQSCADAGANVISMSLGGGGPTRTEQRLYDSIAASNILVVAAAGNNGTSAISYPAGYASVMSVAAVKVEPLSLAMSWADFSQFNADVEIAGPGVGVLSTVPKGSQIGASLTVNGTNYPVQPMDGSPEIAASGPLADFGIGESAKGKPMAGKVCLIVRGTLTFADKVKNCQRAGGVGAVVYNNQPGELFGTLADARTSIPSVGATAADGAAMLGQLGLTANVSIAGTAALYASFSGTSMATPHVSGVAALVWSHFPGCSAEQVRAALKSSALDVDAPGPDNRTGSGVVQALAAYNKLSANCGN